MTETLSPQRPGKLLTDVCRLVAQRVPAEAEIPSGFTARQEAAEKEYQEARKQTRQRRENEKAAAEEEYASARRAIAAQFHSDYTGSQSEYEEVRKGIIAEFEAAENAVKQELQESQWEATTIFEATKDGPALQLKDIEMQLAAGWRDLEAVQQDAVRLLRQRWQWRDYPEPKAADSPPEDDPSRRFAELLSQGRNQWRSLADQAVPRLFEGLRPWMLLLFWLAAVLVAGLAWGQIGWYWTAVVGGAGLVLWVSIGIWLYGIAKRQSTQAYLELRRIRAEADIARQSVLKTADADCQRKRAAMVKQLQGELKEAGDKFSGALAEIHLRKQNGLEQASEKYPALLSEITARRDREMQEAEEKYRRRLREIGQRYESDSNRLREEHAREMTESEQRFEREWGEMVYQWHTGIERFQTAVDQMNRACDGLFPDWSAPGWSNWTPPAEIPPAIRFGKYEATLSQIDGGLPRDERLQPAQTDFRMPALLPFPERSLMLLRASGQGSGKAIQTIQAVMLRMLTSLPPGKVRFTIIDPVGLGENFSAFMHLADYDEQLVSSRIWTDTAHIEQRLTDLTEHMENVIQLYLRNQFESIQEYNEFAGEMAEPYRVLVVANFPANFSENAARRLLSIVASGGRCGVYTLLNVDAKLQLPRDFHLADFESQAFNLRWSDGRFVWKHPDFGELPLVLDGPPEAEQFTDIVRRVGRQVKDAGRVEVPFKCVVPDKPQWWTGDSRGEIDVPLGRAGALKLQHLNLGKGTSQHVLISGKTGSGKSTLLHVLITSLALRYSPDEVELYLVDFKKGVEFKAYASQELPHARVIAIESEREFGLSVLQRLDAELKDRGDLFRRLGVQDLKGFRAAKPDARLPRVLLIIDEFQELFVEEDRIAQNSALLLDRLVRQGRAFGIHVLLGSQTLGGAYTLARSTIGQMAVRIALQCSEADAHLILSEENTAARLLTRPGEAIYNDANGRFEGNHPFQVAWLPDDRRETHLKRIRQFADKRNYAAKPAIVFEGNVPADPSENPLLHELLAADSWPETSSEKQAWLGSAVAIKDPTVAVFARQSGSNLLMVGHREEAALAVLATSLISLAAQDPPSDAKAGGSSARFYIFDGLRPDAPEAGFWSRLAPVVPQTVKVVTAREASGVLAEVAEEAARREAAGLEDAPPIYLIIYDLGRFRDLRKTDDDFGFSDLDENEPPSPSRQFRKLLRDGPALGVHTLLWCDTYNNVSRWFDRQGLRDLELRVLFQMNATDSSNLIDSPAAGRLGVHRAILYNEGTAHLEKFRPYSLPSDDWLAWIKVQLHSRSGKKKREA